MIVAMLVLAADTSTAHFSVALCDGDAVLAEQFQAAPRKHSERLLDAVDTVLAEADKRLSDVNLLALSAGPGSFTGLRVGAAAWKGLALGAGLPLVAVPSLEALAHGAGPRDGVVCALLDARMDEVFAAAYVVEQESRVPLLTEQAIPVESFLDMLSDAALFVGDGAELYRDTIAARFPDAEIAGPAFANPPATSVAKLAAARFAAGETSDAASFQPVYLRVSQAEATRGKAPAGRAAP
jgi:tRNA threonylcarbamoyladenosine biosynthesis protein TsaB